LKTHTKIILAIPLALIAWGAVDYTAHEHRIAQRIAQIEKKTYTNQLAFYRTFLNSGMKRADVERELARRSISFESYGVEGGGDTDDFILLERFESPQWYCSFEDALLRLQFDPTTSLRKTSVYHQLKECL
jgi:hypothetical protein